ncbi:putative reverse transcriptase domain-containing protein, partial [Tanacetum coccineum]
IYILEIFPNSKYWWKKDPDVIPRGISWLIIEKFHKRDCSRLFAPWSSHILTFVPSDNESVQSWCIDSFQYFTSSHESFQTDSVGEVFDAGPSIEERAILFLEAQDHLVSRAEVPVKMPPRRNMPLTEVYEQEFEQRVMARIEERLDQFIDQLADRMNDMMNPRRHRDRNSWGSEGEESENPFFEGGGSSSDEQPDRPRQNQREDNRRWESGMRVFEFKEVPENKRVSLIATKLCGRASAWWQQLKLTRERVGKPRVTSWRKMKKLLRENFIPHNYKRLMYQRLQNLKQGTKSVKDYTTEFYQLIARNAIQETEDQLVSRYIGGLRVQIMDSVNMLNSVTLSDAYQHALAFEKQNRRTKVGGGNTGPVSKGVGSSGLKCFNCGEPGHRQSEYKKAGKRHLFTDEEWEDEGVVDDEYEEPPVFDDDQYEQEIVNGDVRVNLMVRRSCLTPKAAGDDWLKHNIFQST